MNDSIRYDIYVNGELLHKYIKSEMAYTLSDWYEKSGKQVELKQAK